MGLKEKELNNLEAEGISKTGAGHYLWRSSKENRLNSKGRLSAHQLSRSKRDVEVPMLPLGVGLK